MTHDLLDLSVHFERIMRLSDGSRTAHELLLRPVGGGGLAERASAADVPMTWISAFALRTAGAVLERSPLPLHVNITPADVVDPGFVRTVHDHIARADISQLVLEITEHTPLIEGPQMDASLIELRRLGVRFAIDDFGDGWADERSIEIVRPEIIKVRLEHICGEAGRDHARDIQTLADEHAANIVVEQIETAADLAVVVDLGLSHAQGWFWSHHPAVR